MTPRLDAVPRIGLGAWPTPILRMESTSEALGVEVLAKIESECGAWGATKVRKLEYLLAQIEADGGGAVTAAGAGSSTWTATVAHHAHARGLTATVWLAGPVPRDLARLYDRSETRVKRLPGLASAPVAAAMARLSPGHLPAGGSGGTGDLGPLRAGLEIADSVNGGAVAEPREVVIACGTGGTAAGVGLGLQLGGLNSQVLAARVTPLPLGTAALIRHRMRKLARLVGIAELPRVNTITAIGPGYGRPGAAGLEAMALAHRDGLDLDRGYSAKAFAALISRARSGAGGPLLLLHTSPGPPPG